MRLPRRLMHLGLTAVTAGAIAAPAVVAQSASAAVPQPRVVTGWLPWWTASAATASVTANADLFSEASPFWFEATAVGTISIKAGTTGSSLSSMVSSLKAKGVKVVPTVTDAMSPATTGAMLSNAAQRSQHVAALLKIVETYGLDGIDLDYENMAFNGNATVAQQVRTGYPALLSELGAQLRPKGKMLTVAVLAKTVEGTSPASFATDYAAIGRQVDRMRIMTYDQNYSGSAYPGGPVSSVTWTDNVLKFATTQVPAAKIQMGVPAYGYDWKSTGGKAATVTFSQARDLMAKYGAQRQWSATHGAPSFTYTDETGVQHSVWYNDAQSLAARLPLVGKYGLAGIAIWSLGTEDPGYWPVLRERIYGADPFGTLDSVSPAPGGARVVGWAIDANTTGPIDVHVYANGRLVAITSASVSRPDIASTYSLFGENHGFDVRLSLGAGTHQVCAYAINVGAGSTNPNLGCRSVTALSGNPKGYLEEVSAVPGGALIRGWVLDPDTEAPTDAHVYVDGKLAAVWPANQGRPDVAAVYPAYGANHGYYGSLPMSAGTHSVCVYGINVGPGSHTQLGCKQVTVRAGNPFGSIDTLVKSGGGAATWGWAIDPDTAAPIDVHIYVDGVLTVIKKASEVRTDVGAAYPAYGSMHGWSTLLSLKPGKHTVCVYGINVGFGSNTSIGCKTITL